MAESRGMFSSFRSKHNSETGHWEKDVDHPDCQACQAKVSSKWIRGGARRKEEACKQYDKLRHMSNSFSGATMIADEACKQI
jgi:hypothetical protein